MAVKRIDRGWDKYISETEKIDKSFSKVGYPSNLEVGSADRKGSGRQPTTEPAKIIEVAAFHEWGTRQMDSRPTMYPSFVKVVPQLKKFATLFYPRIAAGEMTVRQALGLMGEAAVNALKEEILTFKSADGLAQSTIKRKGSTKELIDLGQMINSITQEVVVR